MNETLLHHICSLKCYRLRNITNLRAHHLHACVPSRAQACVSVYILKRIYERQDGNLDTR